MGGEQTASLGDYVTLTRGTTYQSARLGEPGPVLLGLASIAPEGGFRSDALRTYGGESPPHLVLKPGDLYVSLKDVTQAGRLLGSVARVPATVCSGRLTQDTVKLGLKPCAPPADFLYWILRTPEYRDYCKERAIGTTNLALSRLDFLSFQVPPTNRTRALLCELLSALDEKIELNRRMAETLEAMARALFKSWFVDFDPVHALAEGLPTGLPDGIATLFPDSFGKDGLPTGWRREPLLNHATVISGGTPKTDEPAYWDGPILWASAKDVSQCADGFLISTERGITQKGLDGSATRVVPRLSTVVVARGATTGRHCLFGRQMAMNQTCYALTNPNLPFWLHSAFAELVDVLVQSAHGSVFDTITTNTLSTARVTIGDPDTMGHFEAWVTPLFNRLLGSIEQSESLTQLRDTLLPKLISGELRIAGAEQRIAAP